MKGNNQSLFPLFVCSSVFFAKSFFFLPVCQLQFFCFSCKSWESKMGDMVHFDLVCCTDADRLICIDRRRIKKRNFEFDQEVEY